MPFQWREIFDPDGFHADTGGRCIETWKSCSKTVKQCFSGSQTANCGQRQEHILFLLKKMDRIAVDHFDSFNDTGKVIDFESELKGCVSVDELSNIDAF
jgi:GTP cyclohydrolase III